MKKLWIEKNQTIPAVLYTDTDMSINYDDKSNDAIAWDRYGERVLNYVHVLKKIKTILNTKANPDAPNSYFTGFGTLTLDEQKLMAKNLLMPYSMRLGYYTDEEDIENTMNILIKSYGIELSRLCGRSLIAEQMRLHVFLNFVRKDLMTLESSKLFGKDVKDMLENFERFQDYDFENWLTNAIGTQFEND